jgi:uncharacterized protein YjdB/pimeloyl-ACP methyl ester carboxylesterase
MNKNKTVIKLRASISAIAMLAMLTLSCGKEDAIPKAELSVSPTTLRLSIGDTDTVEANLAPVTWSSNATTIASVNASSGVVKALAVGEATVTAKYSDGQTASCIVTVEPIDVTAITLTPAVAEIYVDSTIQFRATPTPENPTTFNPVWSSSADTVATVSTTGLVTGVSAGTTTITVTAGGISKTAEVTVENYVVDITAITLTPTVAEIYVDSTIQFRATPTPENPTTFNPVWSSSAETVATVSATGLVTGVSAGTATITVTAGGISKTAEVTVRNYVVDITDITLTPAAAKVWTNGTIQLAASPVPQNSTEFNPVWSSGDNTVATVSPSGLVRGISAGTTTITVTSGGISKTAEITVRERGTAETLTKTTLVGTMNLEQMKVFVSDYNLESYIQTGISLHKIEYNTAFRSNTIKVSGLLVIPDDMSEQTPVIVYNHGTMHRNEAPSFYTTSSNAYIDVRFCCLCAASFKCAVLIPDYIGHGISTSVMHPYVHAESLGQAGLDIIRAYSDYTKTTLDAVPANNNVVIFGYSEGGYTSVALHKKIQETAPDINVVKTYAGAGPYDVDYFVTEMLQQNHDLPEHSISSYLWVLATYKEYSGYSKPYDEIFSDADNAILRNNNYSLGYLAYYSINRNPQKLFRQEFREDILAGNDTQFSEILKENTLVDFVPSDSLILFHSEADTWVYVSNTVNAYNTMRSNGAPVRYEIIPKSENIDHEAAAMNFFLGTFFAGVSSTIFLQQ